MIGKDDININKINNNQSNGNNKIEKYNNKENANEYKINIKGSYVELKNQTMKGDVPKHNYVRIRIEKKFKSKKNNILSINKASNKEKTNLSKNKSINNGKLPNIKCYKNKGNLDLNDCNLNDKIVEKLLIKKIKNFMIKIILC